jgi:hypothetical protein
MIAPGFRGCQALATESPRALLLGLLRGSVSLWLLVENAQDSWAALDR